MDHSKTKDKNKRKIRKIHTSQTFTVTQSHTGTSGTNVMVHIEVNKIYCIEFPKKYDFFVLTNICG